jgi:hypothetical protein
MTCENFRGCDETLAVCSRHCERAAIAQLECHLCIETVLFLDCGLNVCLFDHSCTSYSPLRRAVNAGASGSCYVQEVTFMAKQHYELNNGASQDIGAGHKLHTRRRSREAAA